MPYVTINSQHKIHQITFTEILKGLNEESLIVQKDTKDTKTWFTETVPDKLILKTDFGQMYSNLAVYVEKYKCLIDLEDKSKLYRSFKIPKKSGGLRNIDAPNDELLRALRELKFILEHNFYASYHTSAFAYVKGRSTVDAVKRHQANNSRWFLKLDFSKFFPSTTPEFLYKMLSYTYPFSEFVKHENCKELLVKALSLCFLNGGLPQGTPTSPMLTNMMMIPIDYAIAKMCREHTPHLRYTRYADDLLISSEFSFKWSAVRDNIVKILKEFEAPFALNAKKTRYGSRSGSNWNLGVMLNKDNQITVGHEKKKLLKTMLFQFMADVSSGKTWSVDDVQYMLGLISYHRMVERARTDEIIQTYSKKFNRDVIATAKSMITA